MTITRCAAVRSAHLTPRPANARLALRAPRRAALALAVAGVLVSCATTDESALQKTLARPALVAHLRPIGVSALTGAVTFREVDGGLDVAASIWTNGSDRWRAVIHVNPICTSPNGFSAGPPMLVPGTTEPVSVEIATSVEGVGNTSMRLRGLAIDGPAGITGKSVVIHSGAFGSLEALPGVPNNRFACGVIEVAKPIF